MGTIVQANKGSSSISPSMMDVFDAVKHSQTPESLFEPMPFENTTSIYRYRRQNDGQESSSIYTSSSDDEDEVTTDNTMSNSCGNTGQSVPFISDPFRRSFQRTPHRSHTHPVPNHRNSTANISTEQVSCTSTRSLPLRKVRFSDAVTHIDTLSSTRRFSDLGEAPLSRQQLAASPTSHLSPSVLSSSMTSLSASLAALTRPTWFKSLMTKVQSRRDSATSDLDIFP
ncbi:expressed protein [Batrachochytrium dendrobatidis JAM81]|uniref:Expressed protein n=2 Tax=Batrachochytrium dendrobatidis TaxID=109871 RepID=F4NW51_BATDJ|nr:uncharacterized protein BATDEDRAFT_36619 [Batrachochytrium dendrobatidis JAM81]EGF82418.1 expressed protein [Batrachochytrium dendrobatidis JAM81]OAJ39691.1 hypothetical protein BDEG_23521 [Batrachochytrium dendrobatidis JEL423]|eukprot:XP_006676847.1 expressed protein [Batrachochytrium dendrobatidis JAM81]